MRTIILVTGLLVFWAAQALGQCATGTPPSFTSSCTSQYFTSISASGTGVTSTISYSGSSCTASFFDYFSSQGVTAPTGSTVNINISRLATYYAYLLVYVDWNNNGTYETTELASSVVTLPAGTGSGTCSFTIPLIGIVANTNLHMRVFLGEPPSSGGALSTINPPCGARWGQANDYYLNASCTTPTLSVTPPSPSLCGAGSVALTAAGAGSSATYLWSPSTALSATTGATVTASPAATTTYSVTGYGPGVCQANTSATVTINPAVTPAITTSGTTTFCMGGSITLSETSGTGTTYQWYNGSTAIIGATNNTLTVTPATTTNYSVLVSNTAGCTGSAATIVTVLAAPTATIAAAGATTVCSPNTVTLIGASGSGYTYKWFNAGSVVAGATSFFYVAPATGSYEVEVTAPTGCKDTSAVVSITVNPAPTASVTASGPLTLCSFDSLVLTAATGTGYTYQWVDGATAITGAINTTYTTRVPGVHNYRLIVSNGFGCADTTASGLFHVTVNPAPVSAITASGPVTFCAGGSVTLSTVAASGNTYQWYMGATAATAPPISGATTSVITVSTTGFYYVRVTSAAGCTTSSAGAAVPVSVVHIPTTTYSGPLSFCSGGNVTLSLSTGSSATATTYQWKRNSANIAGATASTYNATQGGTYTCFVNIGGGCAGFTNAVTVTVFPQVTPPITYVGGYVRTSITYASYQWYRNGIIITGATTYRVHVADTGNYSVAVTDSNGCHSATSSYHLYSLGISLVGEKTTPRIFPNPATGTVNIDYPEALNVAISSMDGRALIEARASKQVDISALANGLYIVTLFDENGNRVLVEKLVKQ